jgi:hypothetical protein
MPIVRELSPAGVATVLGSKRADAPDSVKNIAASGYNTLLLPAVDGDTVNFARMAERAHRAGIVVIADWRATSALTPESAASWSREALAFLCAAAVDGLRVDVAAALAPHAEPQIQQALQDAVAGLRARRPSVVLVARGVAEVAARATAALDAGGFGLDFVDTAPTEPGVARGETTASATTPARRAAHLARGHATRAVLPARTPSRLATLMLVGRPTAVASVDTPTSSQRLYAVQQATAQSALALLASAAVVDARDLVTDDISAASASPATTAPGDERSLRNRGATLFAQLAHFARKHPAFAPAAFDGAASGMADARDGRQVAYVRRQDPMSGRTIYALVNLNHFGITNLRLSTAAEGDLKLVFDSDSRSAGGKGELGHRLPGSTLRSEVRAVGAAPQAIVPYLAPYATVLLEAR